MHYNQTTPVTDLCSISSQFSVSPDLIPANELKIKYRKLNPYTSDEINVLLLENISEKAVKIFKDAGFNVQLNFGLLTHNLVYSIGWIL